MNVYLLPHHRLDPRFSYTLEREAVPDKWSASTPEAGQQPAGFLRRRWRHVRLLARRLRQDYDQVVHGHEQIRLSRLVLLMDRDPQLTLVIPAGMTRDAALEAVRGVIRSSLMAHRLHAIRNVVTALVMMIVLFGATPTHVAAVIFYPLIGLYAWGRYWEDRLIRRTMAHLLEVRLAGNGDEYFREGVHLAKLEELFGKALRPDLAYREAVQYLDGLDHRMDGKSTPEHALMFKYYSDIGRLDPYDRYLDRIRIKLVETAKLVWHHLWAFWNGAFRWTFSRTKIVWVRVPNLLFVLTGLLACVYAWLWYSSLPRTEGPWGPKSARVLLRFPELANIELRAHPVAARSRFMWGHRRGLTPEVAAVFEIRCPLDSAHIDLWPVVLEMITKAQKHQKGEANCPGSDGTAHAVGYEIELAF